MSKKYLKQHYIFHEDDYNDLINDILETHINSIIELLQSEMYKIEDINAGNNLIIKKIKDNKILLHPNNKDIIKKNIQAIAFHQTYLWIIHSQVHNL